MLLNIHLESYFWNAQDNQQNNYSLRVNKEQSYL